VTKNDYPEFVSVWTKACELYGKPPSDGALDLIFAALQRFDLQAIKQALTAHLNDPKHGDFAPKPADIVRHIDGDGDHRALSAWSQVHDAIRLVGPYETVVFDDPRIMAVIEEMGGWISLCDISDKDLPFKANEFRTRYQAYLFRAPARYPSKLIGKAEAENDGVFRNHIPSPRLIGRVQKCIEVMNQGSSERPRFNRLADVIDNVVGQITDDRA